ncbi:MAG: STAS domain-containing protein [Planctomycetota bacterium]
MTGLRLKKNDLNDGIVLISASGFLDAHTFGEMENLIEDLFKKRVYKIIVQLDKLDYISSAGAGVFIGAKGTATSHGGDIVILSPSPNVKEVFDLLGLSQIFPIAYKRESAIEYFGGST